MVWWFLLFYVYIPSNILWRVQVYNAYIVSRNLQRWFLRYSERGNPNNRHTLPSTMITWQQTIYTVYRMRHQETCSELSRRTHHQHPVKIYNNAQIRFNVNKWRNPSQYLRNRWTYFVWCRVQPIKKKCSLVCWWNLCITYTKEET